MGRMDSWMNGWKHNASSWGNYWCPVIKNVFKTKRLEFNLKLNTNKMSLNNLWVQNTEEKHSTQLFYSLTGSLTDQARTHCPHQNWIVQTFIFGLYLMFWFTEWLTGWLWQWRGDCGCPNVDWFTGQLTGCMLGSLNGSQMFDWLTTCVSEQLVNTLVLFCFKSFLYIKSKNNLRWSHINFCIY